MEHDGVRLCTSDRGLGLHGQFKKTQVMSTSPVGLQASETNDNRSFPMILLGPENTVTTCPFCRASIKTAVRYTTTSRTHMAAASWGFLCCLCCLPYCSESAKNTDHYCAACQKYLGTYAK